MISDNIVDEYPDDFDVEESTRKPDTKNNNNATANKNTLFG